MIIKLVSNQQILQEATEILLAHLGPSKMVRLLANWQRDESNYLKIKDKLFESETVESLYRQARELEEKSE